MQGLKSIVLLPAFALVACGQTPPERGDDAREAEGEVLGGSISDEMLPLDQLRSQSPTIRERVETTVEEDGSTTIETTVTTVSGEGADNQPAPPAPPPPPED